MSIQNSIPVISNEGSKWSLAVQDVIGGVLNYRLWWSISWHEVRQRMLGHARSILDDLEHGRAGISDGSPVWISIQSPNQQVSTVRVWLSDMVTDHQLHPGGANTFIGSAGALTQMRRPLTSYVMRTIARNIIVFFHSIVIFFVVAILFGIYPTLTSLWSLVGLFLVLINLGWMSLFAAIVSTRYRDVPMIIQNVFSVLLWLTPVMYYPSQLTGRPALIIQLNPFSYFLDVVRDPLMNELPKVESFALVAVFAVVGWLSTLVLFSRTRSRIVYWL